MGTWPVWGSEAHGDLRGMGYNVWPARCGIADFAVFCEFPGAADAYGGAVCAGLPQSRAGLGGHEANMGELRCMGTADVYGVRECMGAPFEYGGSPACMGPENL